MRSTFADFKQSMIPQAIGLCMGDTVRLLQYCNRATQILMQEGGETGWYGTWYKTVFSVAEDGTITCPREIARVIDIAIEAEPIKINNQFWEYLEAGVGPQSDCSTCSTCNCNSSLELHDRGRFPTVVDINPVNQIIRVYPTDSRDYDRRIMIKGLDANRRRIYSTDAGVDVDGEIIYMTPPFNDTSRVYSEISGIIKDYTFGDVLIYQADIVTGEQVLLAILAPNESSPSFRRYYVSGLTDSQLSDHDNIKVCGMAKLEFIPVQQDTDFLLIANLPALQLECESLRFSGMDNMEALKMADVKHKQAVRLLNNELNHYLGKSRPAILQPLWGTAKLANQRIGSLV